jgi:Chaperone of endosialidase/Secretion system C-terminal sorting domain
MKKKLFPKTTVLTCFMMTVLALSQTATSQTFTTNVLNDYNNAATFAWRLGRTSIGQNLLVAPPVNNDFKLRVFGGAFTQVQTGTYGNFTALDQWTGLGQNPTVAGIYGLAMHRNDRYGFYNLQTTVRNTQNTKDVVVGFGTTSNAGYDANQRMVFRGFFGSTIANSRTIMSLNPQQGAVGVNDENPLSTLYVNAVGGTATTPLSNFRNIFILNRGLGSNILAATWSAMGQEGNASLNLLTHGFRAQAGDTNAVNGLIAANFSVNTTNQLTNAQQEAEVQWQDLNFTVPVFGGFPIFPVNYTGAAQDRLSFYFRTANNTVNARRRIMTMIGGGHVGINIPSGNPVTVGGIFVAGNPFTTIRMHVNGGSVLANGYYAVSDSTLKADVVDIINPFKLLDRLRPRKYNFKDGEDGSIKIPQFGFIAQEVANNSDVPEIVAKMENGLLAVQYDQVIPILVEAVKQQQTTIATQAAEIRSLKAWSLIVSERLGIAPPAAPATATASDPVVTGARVNTAQATEQVPATTRLLQNSPNPSNGYTEIFYELAENTRAAITIADQQGRTRKTITNLQAGTGKVMVNTSDMEPGVYTYSMLINGTNTGSKQMVIAR